MCRPRWHRDEPLVSDVGYAVVPRWILRDERFTLNMVATYLALQSFAGRDGVVFPGMPALAKRARLGVSTTRRTLRELEAVGVVITTPRVDENGAVTSNHYVVLTRDPSTGAGDPPPVETAPPARSGRTPRPERARKEPQVSNPIEVLISTDVDIKERVDSFDDFWAVYPRRSGKAAAKKSWDAAMKRTLPAVVMAGAVAYRDDPNRVDMYTCLPATWLNQDRWEDDPLPSRVDATPRKIGQLERNVIEVNRIIEERERREQHRSIETLGPGLSEGWENGYGNVGRSLG
jgi:hypothetical protein